MTPSSRFPRTRAVASFVLTPPVALLLTIAAAHAQQPAERWSIHRVERERHATDTIASTAPAALSAPLSHGEVRLSRRVFGYYPNWNPTGTWETLDFDLLSDIAWFGFSVDTLTGSAASTGGWTTTPLIEYAHERGVRVVLAVTNFGYAENDAILLDPVRQDTLIETLVRTVRARDGDGVNIDFEAVRAARRDQLTAFMQHLAVRMHASIPNSEVSIAVPAVDWNDTFDKPALAASCDFLMLMAYDYHWSTAPTAGPVAPLLGESYNVTRSVDTYLADGVPPDRLLLGVPWYGLQWPVADTVRMTATTGTATALTYPPAEASALQFGKHFDLPTLVPWYTYLSPVGPLQTWYDDSLSLALKYDLVNQRDLAGIGIWALGYDGGAPEIWGGIGQAFTVPVLVNSEGRGNSDVVAVWPNPSTGGVHFEIRLHDSGPVTLRLADAVGRMLATPVDGILTAGVHRISVDALAPGAYFWRLESHGSVRTGVLVVE